MTRPAPSAANATPRLGAKKKIVGKYTFKTFINDKIQTKQQKAKAAAAKAEALKKSRGSIAGQKTAFYYRNKRGGANTQTRAAMDRQTGYRRRKTGLGG